MRTCISKKLLAGALSVMMVVSLFAGIPANNAQAASKYSVTGYKTVKAGATRTYTVKGVKKTQYIKVQRNVKGETVKYNGKALTYKTKVKGTGKNLKLKVKFSEKNKNYTGKFTVRIYNAKSNKLVKKLVKKVSVKTKVEKTVAITGVSLDNTTPKVGDTISAIVAPANATGVSYAWYMGDTAATISTLIEGQTSNTLTITNDMLGKFIQVVVTGDKNSSANAATVAAVAEAESTQVAIVKAEQTGAKTIKVSFSAAVTVKDALSVKKGTNAVKIDGVIAYAEDFMSAIITLADKITATEYTVTLTPEDTKVAATEAKFTGALAELKEIKFLNKVLVMKDNDYKEGYAYVKGYDQFGGEVSLSGLTVTSGVGSFKSYDSATGKITIVDNTTDKTGAFLLIKEVPVFVQYQQGNNMLTANETLTVSTRAYVSELEFGDIGKDGTMREDKILTMTELKSGKYYVEIKNVKDQYGNTLSADDLEAQRTGDQKVLFVIPDDKGAFYSTGKFGVLGGKTVLWLDAAANAKPGQMELTITGASGKSFKKMIEVKDDPYIATMNVTYPEIYAGQSTTAALEFSAKDQYGNDVNMWDVKPQVNPLDKTELLFTDYNAMTTNCTKIVVSGATFNQVISDSGKKTFKVTLDASKTEAKKMVTFTVTTAGMDVKTAMVTVGEQGNAAKVKSTLAGGNRQLVQSNRGRGRGYKKDEFFNFNQYVQFEDANGNTMVRGKDERYPAFTSSVQIKAENGNVSTDTSKLKADDYNKGTYVWSLTKEKVVSGKDITVSTTGIVEYNDIAEAGKGDFYVTIYLKQGATYYVLDDQDFHLTAVTGEDKSFEPYVEDVLYAAKDSECAVPVYVKAKTKTGETYEVSADRIDIVVGGDFETKGSYVFGALKENLPDNTSGEMEATVYVTKWGTNERVEAGTVKIPYSNEKRTAAYAYLGYVTGEEGSEKPSLAGYQFNEACKTDTFVAGENAKIQIADGEMDIIDANAQGDTIFAFVYDQYFDVPMPDTAFYVEGKKIAKDTVIPTGKAVTFQFKNGSQSQKFYVTFTKQPEITVVEPETKVDSLEKLKKALKEAGSKDTEDNITLVGDVKLDANITVAKGDTLVVDENVTLDTNTNDIEVAGALVNNGEIPGTGNIKLAGTYSGTGTSEADKIILDNGATVNNQKGVKEIKDVYMPEILTTTYDVTLWDNVKLSYLKEATETPGWNNASLEDFVVTKKNNEIKVVCKATGTITKTAAAAAMRMTAGETPAFYIATAINDAGFGSTYTGTNSNGADATNAFSQANQDSGSNSAKFLTGIWEGFSGSKTKKAVINVTPSSAPSGATKMVYEISDYVTCQE